MLVLAATGLGAIDLDDQAEGYVAESWSLGPPQVRDVVENRTLANGTIDWTSFVGSRALVMTVSCFPTETRTVQGQIDRLAAFCRPDLRPTLTWGFDTDAERMVVMRANPGLDVEFSTNSYRWRRVGLSFVVPDSMQWGVSDQVSHVYPTGGAEVGRTYYEAEEMTPGVSENLIGTGYTPPDERASMETGSTTPASTACGWGRWGTPQAMARSTAAARHGLSSLALTRSDGTAGAVQATPYAGGATRFPVNPGHVYTQLASLSVPSPDPAYGFQMSFTFRDAALVDRAVSSHVDHLGATWLDRAFSFVAPVDAVDAYLLTTSGVAAGATAYLDRVGLYDEGLYEWSLPSASGVNLLTDAQASIETGSTTPSAFVAGWAGATANQKVARSTTWAVDGASSLALTTTTPGNVTYTNVSPTGADEYVPLTAGRRYWLSADFLSPTARSFGVVMNCYDAATVLTPQRTRMVIFAASAEVETTVLYDFVAPANTVKGRIQFLTYNAVAGETIYMDRAMLREAPTPPDFALPSEAVPGVPTGEWGRGYERTYPTTTEPANVTVINPGQIAVPWVARIHGPCVNPCLYNDTVGDGLLLTANGGLTLGAGDYVTLDSAARTITVDGANRYDRLDIAKSRWWSLAPGDNRIRFQPSQFSEGSSAEITWRSAWL